MEIGETKKDNVVILEPVGRIDTNTSSEFELKIVALLDAGEKKFVIDLENIDYISSAGLRVLLMAGKKLKTIDGNLILCSMSDHIKEVFDLAGFTPIFSISPSRSEATAILQ